MLYEKPPAANGVSRQTPAQLAEQKRQQAYNQQVTQANQQAAERAGGMAPPKKSGPSHGGSGPAGNYPGSAMAPTVLMAPDANAQSPRFPWGSADAWSPQDSNEVMQWARELGVTAPQWFSSYGAQPPPQLFINFKESVRQAMRAYEQKNPTGDPKMPAPYNGPYYSQGKDALRQSLLQ